jgi:FAD/FMN-containing dehydrogenase
LKTIESWGRLAYKGGHVEIITPSGIKSFAPPTGSSKFLPIGAGRSYGDVGLNPQAIVVSTSELTKFISFDSKTGVLECESGVLIRDIQATFASRGWISPVTPGTSFVTVGGAIANDVHGKNHHTMGSFGNHILEFVLARSDGSVLECSESENQELFRATIGGLGLTGVILTAKIQLTQVPSTWVNSERISFSNLEEFFTISKDSEADFESSVAWFDCSTSKAGRGSFIRGNHVATDKPVAPVPKSFLTLPFTPPGSLINGLTLSPLNTAYYHLQKRRAGRTLESMWSFYYPLDSVHNWNRAYGPGGFFQYQSVVPASTAESATLEMLKIISKSGLGSFLAVLKAFGGVASKGLLSFPMEGTTLALDFPNKGDRTEKLFRTLDEVVMQAGGRLNPSKDARMSADVFQAGFPNHQEFCTFRDQGISSGFSRRIFGS